MAESGRYAMVFVPFPNCVEAAIIFEQQGENVENTFHYRLSAPATGTVLENMTETLDGYCSTHANIWPTNVGVIKYYARALDTQFSPTWEENPDAAISGTLAGSALPNDCTLAITRYTGLAGRQMRGRIYWVGITESEMDDANQIAITHAASRVTWCEGLRTAMAASAESAVEVIAHKKTGTTTTVVGYRYSDLFLDNQRRRLPGHNRHH